MFKVASEFSMKDQSSQPYAWMIENTDLGDIENVQQFVRASVKIAISTQNESNATDKTVYRTWRSGWEFNQIVAFINFVRSLS